MYFSLTTIMSVPQTAAAREQRIECLFSQTMKQKILS